MRKWACDCGRMANAGACDCGRVANAGACDCGRMADHGHCGVRATRPQSALVCHATAVAGRAWQAVAGRVGPVTAALLLLLALIPSSVGRAAPLSLAQDGGTTAVYAPDDPLLYGPSPSRFGHPRTTTVYRDGRLAAGWRNLSSTALAFSVAPPSGWGGRALRVTLAPHARIELRAPARIDARGGGYLTVTLNGGSIGGQRLSVALTYDGGQLAREIPSSIVLPHGAAREQWQTIQVPVQNLVPPGTRVDGVLLREDVGLHQPPLYIGAITLQAIPLARALGDAVPLTVSVNASAGRHAISPYIYGLAGTYGAAYTRALRPTLIRWGGNQTTRFNWRIGHAWNTGSDYFYHNTNFGVHTGSAADAMAAQANAAGATMLFTIPTIGWVAKDTTSFSFPGPHGQPTDGQGSSCTNPLVRSDPRRTSIPVGPSFMQAWVRHLLDEKHFDVRFFAMDNEPELWGVTHYDVHPTCTGYDEIYHEFTTYASAVKAVAPHAMVTGPVTCCWYQYYHSMLGDADRLRHDGLGFLPWFLQSIHNYDRGRHQRTLDVLDIHYYPEGAYNSNGDAVTAAWRLQETRSLWDPNYVDHSYINEPVRLIPRMDDLISYWYPGTRLGISEWNWGDEGRMDGALAVADVLGIYGQQGLYMASYWAYPPPGCPAALAFQMFRNYDGHGAAFGETSVSAVSSNQSRLSVYASTRRRDDHLLVLLVNKMPSTTAVTTLDLRGFGGKSARVYRYDAAQSSRIIEGTPITIGVHTQVRVAPYSLMLLDVAP